MSNSDLASSSWAHTVEDGWILPKSISFLVELTRRVRCDRYPRHDMMDFFQTPGDVSDGASESSLESPAWDLSSAIPPPTTVTLSFTSIDMSEIFVLTGTESRRHV